LLRKAEFAFENRSMLFDALVTCKIYKKVDFGDVLISKIAAHYGASKTYSFDKAASQLEEFELVG
jgi:predicted nucleic-acid-binding protein